MAKTLLTSEAGQRVHRDQRKVVDKNNHNALLEVLNSIAGRRFLWYILDEVCNLHGSSYAGSREDTFFCEGKRSVGVRLMKEAQELAPHLYVKMLSEAIGRAETDSKIQEAARAAMSEEGDDDE